MNVIDSTVCISSLTVSGYVNFIFTAHQRSCRKLVFSVVTVCLSVILSMERGSHVIITHNALGLIIQELPSWPQPLL